MGDYDRYEDRRQNEKDLERLEAEREARIKRQELEIKLTRRLRDNPDALRVLHGAEDGRLMRDIMGQRVPSGTQKLTVIKLQFFAVGATAVVPDIAHRHYASEFSRQSTYFIYFQVDLKNPLYGIRSQTYKIAGQYHNPQGILLATLEEEVEVQSGWEIAYFHHGLGPGPTGWSVGLHRVDILVNGEKQSYGYFIIY